MRAIKYFFMVTILLLLLCSCIKGSNGLDMKLSPENKKLTELASKVYSDSQLLEIVRFDGMISEWDAKYPIECIRQNKGGYRISYRGEDNIAVIEFDGSGNKIVGKVYSAKLSKYDFSSLTEGQSLSDVQKIDSEGDYYFLYTGRNDIPKISTHCTYDGYLITIEYDTTNTISNIEVRLI